ncbi:MAG: toll/interleukin-1 receptor domain-containing protein [Caldilineales bacterium]|nr:toll/interleukin-1 receptor domain-containing protein [Caldilineales bacterium]
MNNFRKLRLFLCHASQDKPIVRELHERLLAEGWIDSWLDDEKLLPGQDWAMEIEKAVELADAVIVCFSNQSVTKEGFIQRELRYVLDIALEKPEERIFIIPLRLDDCQPPRRLRNWQYADFFPQNNREQGYQKLLSSIKTLADKVGVSFGERELVDKLSIPASFMERLEKNVARENRNIPSVDEDLEMLSWRETLQYYTEESDEVEILISKEKESVVYKKARELFESKNYLESSVYWNELCKRRPSNEEYVSYLKLCIAKIKRNQSVFINNSNDSESEKAANIMSALHSLRGAENYGIAYNLSYYGYVNFNEPYSSEFFDIYLDMKRRYSEQLQKTLLFYKSKLQENDAARKTIDQAIVTAKKLLIVDPSRETEEEIHELEQVREKVAQRK